MPAADHLSNAAHTRRPLLLGVDGGGTKTVAAVAVAGDGPTPTLLATGRSGPSNPRVVGLSGAQTNILRAVQTALADAERSVEELAAACLGLAGTGREPARQAMLQWASDQKLGRTVRVVHDGTTVLTEGTEHGYGIALIAGTGSFAFGTTAEGRDARAGGWGTILGDEGSGQAIGTAALRSVTRAADGRGPSTQLTQRVLDFLQLQTAAELIAAVDSTEELVTRFASLAPLVFDTAVEGDPVAQGIIDTATSELADHVVAVGRQLGFDARHYELALAGGVLAHQPLMADGIVARLQQRDYAPAAHTVVAAPVLGALRLAQRFATDR